MTTILHIAASPVAVASRTRTVAQHLIDCYLADHPGGASCRSPFRCRQEAAPRL